MSRLSPSQFGLLLLVFAAMVDSTSGLFTRLLSTTGFTTASARGFMAFGFLVILLLMRDGWRGPAAILRIGAWGLAFVGLNALGMVLNILSLSNTSVANFFMIFATAPFVAAIAARFVLNERLDVPTLLAALAGFAGIAVMMASGAQSGGLLGDLLAVGCLFCYAALVLLVRRAPSLDMLPVIAVTVLMSGLLALPFADFGTISSADWVILALFGAIQLAGGNLLIFAAVRRIPAAQGGLLGILNAAFAPAWVFLALGEVPSQATLVGGAIILSAAIAHLIWTLTASRRSEQAA
jgi:drug/metabolite transporter (DMT)-like permease